MLSFYSFLFFCMLLFPSTQAAVFASSSSVDSVTAALARANLFPEVLSSSSLALEGLLSISFGPGTEAASIGRTLDVQSELKSMLRGRRR